MLPRRAGLGAMVVQIAPLENMLLQVVSLALHVLPVRLIMTRMLLRLARIVPPAKLQVQPVRLETASLALRANTLQRERLRASPVSLALSMETAARQLNARIALLVRSPQPQGLLAAARFVQLGNMQQQAQRPASIALRVSWMMMVTRLLNASPAQLGHTRMVQTPTLGALHALQVRQIRIPIHLPYVSRVITGNMLLAAERCAKTVQPESTTTIW